jgi:hypothetical protein
MPDEDRGPVLPVKRSLGGGDVIFERSQRVLDDRHAVAASSEQVINPTPSRSVRESAVNQDDVLGWLSGGRLRAV